MLLTLEGLNKTYSSGFTKVQALSKVSLSLSEGEFVAVQGPSGSGKSTLLLVAGTMLEPDSGTVLVAGQAPYSIPANARAAFRASHIGFVFQQFHLLPYLNVFENVQAASLGLKGSAKAANSRVELLLEQFGLTDRSRHYPCQLSIGERQRCSIARALLNAPKILLADEPSGSLDDSNSQIVLQELRQFSRNGGAVLLVTHDPIAAQAADRIVHMQSGVLSC